MAWFAGSFCSFCSLTAVSTIKIPFFMTIPISIMQPISAMTEKSIRHNIKNKITPMMPEGKVEIMTSGRTKLSYKMPKWHVPEQMLPAEKFFGFHGLLHKRKVKSEAVIISDIFSL